MELVARQSILQPQPISKSVRLQCKENHMEFLSALWMPILVSAVFVWIASFLCHMVLPLHKGEWQGLPNEEAVSGNLQSVKPGLYMFPFGTMAQMKDPDFMAKVQKGPNGLVIVWDSPVNMGKNLILTLAFYILVGIFVAYIGWHGMSADATFMHKLRMTGAIAFAAHGLGWMSHFIWYRYGRFWPNFIDSVIYALVTGATFAWLWPAAA